MKKTITILAIIILTVNLGFSQNNRIINDSGTSSTPDKIVSDGDSLVVTGDESISLHLGGVEKMLFTNSTTGLTGQKYIFMENPADWLSAHPTSTYPDDVNHFHVYVKESLGFRTEFENHNGAVEFYLEGNSGGDAWYGVQDGATHLYSFGCDGVDNDFYFSNTFGIDGNLIYKIENTTNEMKMLNTTSFGVPVGTTAERGDNYVGAIRYNSDSTSVDKPLEIYNGTEWKSIKLY